MLASLLLTLFLAGQPAADVAPRIEEAARLLAKGQPAAGLAVVEDVLSRHGDVPEALALKGLMLDALGRPLEARPAYEAAVRLAPTDPNILRQFGAHWLRQRQWDKALALFELSLKVAPQEAETLFLLARARFEKNDLHGAVEAIERCVALAPDNPMARQARDRYVAAAAGAVDGQKAGARSPAPPPHAEGRSVPAGGDPYTRVQEAKAFLEKGQPVKTLPLVDALLKEYPSSQSSLLLRAMALDDLGRLDEAKTSYEAALRIAPDDPQILAHFGMHFMRAEAWTEAIRYLERSNAAKEDADALFYLAQSYFHTDMKGKALEAIERCVVLEPRNPAALVKLGEYRAHASKFAPALEALRAAQQINPQEPGLDLALGVVNLSLLDVEAARVALERAEKKDPDNLAVLSNLATACAKARDHAAAKRYYERLLALGQDDAHYYMGLGAALLGLGEYEAAIRALAQAVERNPKIAEAHFHLTRAYRSAGHAEEAERELRIFSALKANPFQPFDERTDLERSLWQRAEDFVKDGKESEALKLLATGNASGNEPNYLVGALCYSLGHYAAAEVLLTEAIKAAPDLPKVHAYLGLTYLELGRMAEAESAIRDEATRNPRDPLALMAVGELHFRKQEWAEAARALEESRVVEPRVLLMLCEAQLESGQKARAQESAQLVATLAQDPRTIASLKQLFERYGLAVEGAPASGGSADGADAGP